MRDTREKRDRHALNEDGMLVCNPRDREAAHRAEVGDIATGELKPSFPLGATDPVGPFTSPTEFWNSGTTAERAGVPLFHLDRALRDFCGP
jgi:hypothetical protein